MQRTWSQFIAIASESGIPQGDIHSALDFFHDSGILIHLERPSQKSVILLNPQALANVLSDVVGLTGQFSSLQETGIISRKNLEKAWAAYPRDTHGTLLDILEKFEVAFRVKASEVEEYCLPSLLPAQVPARLEEIFPLAPLENEIEVGRIYSQNFLPLGFFFRLLVRLQHLPDSTSHLVWRSGLLLSVNQEHSLVTFNTTSNSIVIKTRIPKAVEATLHGWIIDVISTMLESYPFIEP